MAKKLWCIPPFHPLVVEVSNKYNMSRDEAKAVINETRRNNPALNDDNIDLSFLEQQDEFKSAIKAYRDKYIDVENILNPIEEKERKVKRDEINSAFDRNLSQAEIDEILSMKDEMGESIKTSKLSSDNIAKVFTSFRDPRRMDFIGHYIQRRVSELVTFLQTDPTYAEENGIKNHNSRAEFYDDPDVREFIKDMIVGSDFALCINDLEKDGNSVLANELKAAGDNYFSLLYMYGGDLFREEGINVGPDGIMSSSKISSTSEDRNDSSDNDAEEDDDDIENEEKPVGDFSVSDQNKSVYSKIVPDIKIMLSNCIDGNETDKFGYGLPVYISVSEAMNRLHTICDRCKSSSEVMDRLESKMESEPWIQNIYYALETSTDIGVSEGIVVPESRKEQLQTMFFQSVVKPFTQFKQTFKTFQMGEMAFATSDGNINSRYDDLTNRILSKFRKMAGPIMFKGGALDADIISDIKSRISPDKFIDINNGSTIEERILRARNNMHELADSYANTSTFAPITKEIDEIIKSITNELRNLGVDVSKRDIERLVTSKEYNRTESNKGTLVNKFEARISQLQSIVKSSERIIKSLLKWCDYNDGDNAANNPFTQKRIDGQIYELAEEVRKSYRSFIRDIAESSPDSRENSAHMNGKDFYSRNNPSSIGTLIENLKEDDTQKLQDYIKKKYAQDTTWFVKDTSESGEKSTSENPHFYSDWLEDIYYSGGRKTIAYAEKPLTNGKSYDELSDIEYALSILNDYFGTTGTESELAWYRMLIASDKPRYSIVRNKKYTDRTDGETGYHSIISRKAGDFFAQELKRAESVMRYSMHYYSTGEGTRIFDYDPNIDTPEKEAVIEKMLSGKNVTINDVVKDGKYIFEKSGAAFYMTKFINSEIENKTDLGKIVVNKIFNSHLKKRGIKLLTDDELKKFREVFQDYMDETTEKYYDFLKEAGLLEWRETKDEKGNPIFHAKYIAGNLVNWHQDDQNYMYELYVANEESAIALALDEGETLEDLQKVPGKKYYYCELIGFLEDLEEFVYNNWLAKANMSQLFDVDLAFYRDTPNFQKRNAQVVSAGYIADPDARIHGQRVSDGKYRSITIKTPKVESAVLGNIKTIYNAAIAKESNSAIRKQLAEARDNILNTLRGKHGLGFDSTDGQALTSLTALRKRFAGQGNWSRSNTRELDETGYVEIDGVRNYIFTDEAVYQRLKRGNPAEIQTGDLLHVFGEPQKPFVYSAINMQREGRGTITVPVQHKNSEYLLPYAFVLSSTAAPNSQAAAISRFLEESAEDDITKGIDTVNFDSGVKIGNNSDMIDITGLDGDATLKKLRSAIYQTDDNGNYIKDSAKRKIKREGAAGVVTEYDIQDYKIVQQKPEHFKKNAQPLGTQMKILAINNIKDDAECSLPDGRKISGKELKKKYFDALNKKMWSEEKRFRNSLGLTMPHSGRIHRLSETLKRAMSTDQKFDAEMRRALSVTDRDGIDQFVLPLDDPSIQSAVESMLLSKIRRAYYKEKTNGGVVVQATSWGTAEDLNIRFYSSNPADKDGLIPVDADDTYKEKYQTGFAYFECEMPMPDYIRNILAKQKGGLRRFLNNDGTWDMEEIKKVLPDSAFDCISYRIPTEAKYSIMLGRIVRFAPSWSGSVGKFPKELTIFSGSDFDIDTDFVELRPIEGSDDYDIDKTIFDLQVAALRSDSGVLETFRPGDFSDLQELSYYVTCLRNGMSQDELATMSPGQIKDACDRFEDMDLLDPKTDIMLRKQNADAKNMIGIAAVGVTSHAFLSLYNDSHISEPENCIRVSIRKLEKGENESFTVINDKAGEENATVFDVRGQVVLDATHDMDGKLIGTEISKYVGGSADAAKDAALYRMNIVEDTLPILICMHRLGISSDVARLFISQPVIRDVVRKMNSNTAFDYCSFDDTIKSVIEEIEQEINKNKPAELQINLNREFADIRHQGDVELRYSDLIKNIESPELQSYGDKLKQLHVFMTLHSIQRQVSNLDSFTRYNSANAMKGTSYIDRFVERQKIKRLERNLNVEPEKARILLPENVETDNNVPYGEFGKLFSMFPYIGRTIAGEEELDEQIFQEEMHTYGAGFIDAAKRLHLIDDPNQTEDAKKLRTLYNGWKSYLMFVGSNRIADFNDESVARYYTRDFEEKHWNDELVKIQEEHPDVYNAVIKDNTFVSAIGHVHAKDGYGDFNMCSCDITKLSGPAREQFKRDWEALLNYPETRKLAIDIAIHFLARNSGYARDTPVVAMPLAIKEAIPNYTRIFTDADKVSMSEDDFDHFVSLFLRNNSEKDKGMVPHVYNTKSKTRYGTSDDGTKLLLDTNLISAKLDGFINKNASGELEMSMPIICLDDDILVEITNKKVETIKIGNNTYYSLDFAYTEPLGIPNQMSEYGGDYVYTTGTLMVDPGEEVPSADQTADTGSLVAEKSDDESDMKTYIGMRDLMMSISEDYEMPVDELYTDDRRSGSYFSSRPFGDDEHDDNIDLLAEDPKDFNRGYLETRRYLQRVKKVSSVLGFDMKNTQRGISGDSPTYVLNLVPTRTGIEEQHEAAIRTAAVASALGFKADNPRVKTYVSDARDDYNAVEIAIPIVRYDSSLKSLADRIENCDWEYNSDRNELQFTIKLNTLDENKKRKLVASGIKDISELHQLLIGTKVATTGKMTASLVKYNVLSQDQIDEELDIIRYEANERKPKVNGENVESPEDNEKREIRKQVRLADLAELAIRRRQGEKVEQELRALFNEGSARLKTESESWTTSKLLEEAWNGMDENAYNDIASVIDNAGMADFESPMIDALLIRTANWILSNGSRGELVSAYTEQGISESSAESIISQVENIIKEQDIC